MHSLKLKLLYEPLIFLCTAHAECIQCVSNFCINYPFLHNNYYYSHFFFFSSSITAYWMRFSMTGKDGTSVITVECARSDQSITPNSVDKVC